MMNSTIGTATPSLDCSTRIGSSLHLYRELWEHSHGRRLTLVATLVLLAGAQVVLLAVPYMAGSAINALQAEQLKGLGHALSWLAGAFGVAVASWLLHGPARILERNIAVMVRGRVATGLVDHLLRLPLAWHTHNHSAASAHRVIQSSSALSTFAENQFMYLGIAIKVIGPVVALWLIHPAVGIAAAFGLFLTFTSILRFEKRLVRLACQTNSAERDYSAALVDTLSNSTAVLALRQARGVSGMIRKKMDAIFVPLRESIVVNEIKWCTVDLSTRALACALVVLFALLASHDRDPASGASLMLGSVYMVWEYARQAGVFIVEATQRVQTFAQQHADYRSADQVREAQPAGFGTPERDSAPSWDHCNVAELVFRHWPIRSQSPNIEGVSIALRRGRRYALIGDSGAGKSTLLRLLAGLYVAEQISVGLPGATGIVSPADAARFFRSCTTLIPQDAELFEGSLGENLGLCESIFGPPSADDYPLALKLATADNFLETGEESMSAPVSERGTNWSGGQRSRIALARGILAARGSALVMLDEPTASLDIRTEAIVYQNLFAEFSGSCLIAAVHRLHLLPHFDEVIVMRGGRVVAQGSALALADTSCEYRELRSAWMRE